jgi:outer membrane protein OmpA-like peptidoglycan-associated protein
MTTCRTIGIGAPLRTLLIAAGLSAGASVAAAAEAPMGDALLAPTPLILKDGRIANVSVHVVAFGPGRSALDSAIAQKLRLLTAEVATDCFLTAQVIGHVGSGEVAGNDTLNAHRLARARADAVQASLIEAGLPAKAIASVWDWQFMVRDARATLWVFQLTPGEDCEGAPLDSAAPALVARAEPPAASEPRPAPSTSVARASAPTARDAAPAEPRTASPASPAPVSPPLSSETATTRPAIAETPSPATAAPVAAVPARPVAPLAEVPTVTRPLPAGSAAEPRGTVKPAEARRPVATADVEDAPAATKPAQTPPRQSAPAATTSAARPQAEVVAAVPNRAEPTPAPLDVKEERLAIVFPNNSSYFPPGTSSQLRALLRTLAENRRYEVVLESSVSGSRKVVGAETEEEARYNQGLAGRRLERVQEWLAEHAAGSELVIKPEYRADDESRQVVIRIRPIG